jgi:hypothetical protein
VQSSINATITQLRATQKGCDDAHYRNIDKLARLLSEDLMQHSRRFRAHGWLGIFSDIYNGSKARFIFDSLCARRLRQTAAQVCEVGFNAGHSAMLFLESLPNARLITFDVGGPTKPWLLRQRSRLESLYGERFELIVGDSKVEVPTWASRSGHTACDVVFIDGSKTYEGRLADLVQLHSASHFGTTVFLDEVR